MSKKDYIFLYGLASALSCFVNGNLPNIRETDPELVDAVDCAYAYLQGKVDPFEYLG